MSATQKKKPINVSESKLVNSRLDESVDCPKCNGKNSKGCKLCGGHGEVSRRKAQNFSS